MKVKSVTYSGKADVYNVTVDEAHTFVANGGFITHNCDSLRYMCQSRIVAPILKEPEAPPLFNPLASDNELRRRA